MTTLMAVLGQLFEQILGYFLLKHTGHLDLE